jgi:formamidopyrimidine-DNA glycosylase
MPELPEVETIRRDLQFALLGKGIRSALFPTGKCITQTEKQLRELLEGNRFESVRRRGKLLIFDLAFGDKTLLVHLKMTGQLICHIPGGLIVGGHPQANIDDLPNKHTHAVIALADKTTLYFNDVRTFGYFKLVSDEELEVVLNKFGHEPLEEAFTFLLFDELFKKRTTSIKAFLLNQQVIAGIGNIYADEICYRAKVHPGRPVNTISLPERKRLFTAIKKILDQAVSKRGTTFSDYVDASGNKGGFFPYLKVYNQEGERCHRCGDDYIEKIKLAGRGTHFCRSCQV